jgi:hypothetical protein
MIACNIAEKLNKPSDPEDLHGRPREQNAPMVAARQNIHAMPAATPAHDPTRINN